MNQSTGSFSRRKFFAAATAAGAGFGLAGAMGAAVQPVVLPKRKTGQKSVFGLKFPPMSQVRIGFIGVGGRGSGLLGNLLDIEGVEIKAVCDIVPDRVKGAQQRVVGKGQAEPAPYAKNETDFENLCRRDDLDVVYIATPWDWHARMAVSAMQHGKHAMIEVPAAITLDECWQLVDIAEQTQRHCLMLENCCYGETELLVLSMVRQGVWKKLNEQAQKSGGHGGMDYVMNWRLIQCLREGLPLDMTVYDAAAWSSVFPLSIESVTKNSAPVAFPDFTRGEWKNQKPVGIVGA